MNEHVDVLVVGAGLSGIGAACQLTQHLPERSVAVLEARDDLGGTWDLFRYPGIRSDSDMFTFGYRWRPWIGDRALADGPHILEYLRSVAHEHDVDKLVRYRHRVTGASWDSGTRLWTVRVEHDGQELTFTARFLWGCTGYYDYDRGHEPEFPGQTDFRGRVVHPQHWPEDLDHSGRRVVVIGSGATAVTLVPAMAGTAEHVTMLQRTPSYVLSRGGRDPVARLLGRLPGPLKAVQYPAARWANIGLTVGHYVLARRAPGLAKRLLRRELERHLPEHVDPDVHFNPPYEPWDQRLCFVPDADLFRALADGTASIVTDTIERFTERGIRLASGRELVADLVVTATGLRLLPFGGIDLEVDGSRIEPGATMAYRGLMLSDVPNFAFTLGYANASWTLRADLVSEYVVRLLRHMDERGHTSVVARRDPSVRELPFVDLVSGYVRRGVHLMPRQGDRRPWRNRHNYLLDRRLVRGAAIEDGILAFS